MKYCTNCGAKLNDEHKFCPYCGHEVENSYTEVTPESVAAVDETPYVAPAEEPTRDDIDNYFNNVGNEQQAQRLESHENRSAKETSPVFAILALVFGILGGWLGILFGAIGLAKYKSGPYRNMCIAGIVLAVVWIAISVAIRVSGVLEL